MTQLTMEFYVLSTNTALSTQINDFMDDWNGANDGHLTVNSVHSFEKMFPGDGKKGTWVLVVFDQHPMSEFECELIRANQFARTPKR